MLSSRGFNDAGQIVFWAELEDGSSGLYLATPVGEGVPGDFSGDGQVNTEDINPFILALTSAQGQAVSGLPADLLAADPNGDGVINTEDINAFVALLTGDGVGAIIPEPGSATVMLLLAAGLMARRRGR
jgi:hypothetical protein